MDEDDTINKYFLPNKMTSPMGAIYLICFNNVHYQCKMTLLMDTIYIR